MHIQLACHPNSYGRYGVWAALDHLPQIGINWIELPIKNAGGTSPFGETPFLTEQASPETVSQAHRQIEQAGLSIASCNLTSGNPLEEAAFQATLTKLSIAADLGVRWVVAGGGSFRSVEEQSLLVRHLQIIGAQAESLGITYCCETHPGACQNADSMLALLAQVDHPSIRLNFDTANILFYNAGVSVFEQLDRVLPFVRHFHLKDSRGVCGEWDFPALGAGGAVDFQGLRSILTAAEFPGPLSLEIEGLPNEHELPLAVHHARLEDSVAHLRACGFVW